MELHSKRLILRQYTKDDKESLMKLLNDKEVSRWTERIPFPYTEKHADWWVNNKPEDDYVYAIVKKDNHSLVGGINITTKGEIGCWIGRKYWKEGFASEAVERIKKFGFEDLKLEKLWAATHEENKASMQVLEKTRFYRVDDRPYHVEGVGDTKMRPHFELTK